MVRDIDETLIMDIAAENPPENSSLRRYRCQTIAE
jgi:hypothetical protein